MQKRIEVGDKIPSFTIEDHEGFEFNSEDLVGSPFVLYFYPKDDTPGCTKEACSFRDNLEQLDELDTLVIGVSADDAKSHNTFIDKYNLNFTLLCDVDLELSEKFGVLKDSQEKKGIQRTTFLIDAEGIVRWIERPVSVEGHTERVIEAVKALTAQK